jgi:Leucine-rich repeat (LRR) protein
LATLPISEQYALQALHIAFSGPQMDSWGTDYAFGCSFPGVKCDNNDRIIEIVMLDTKRDVEIGSSLSGLEAIETLVFMNPVRDPLDPPVLALSSLKHLQISGAPALEVVSADVVNLTSLEKLVIERTNVVQVDNIQFGSLPALTSLVLAHNRLSAVPATLYGLNELRHLDLSGNNLSVLPAWLTTLPLQGFSCTGCNLIAWPDAWFSASPCIETLDLSNNSLSTFPSLVQSAPSCLTFLNLEKNVFSSNSIFPALSATQSAGVHLNLAKNALASVPASMCSIESIETLDLSVNGIDLWPAFCLENSSLISLDLSHNQLTQVPSVIDQYTQLQRLNLSHNFFSGDIPPALRMLPSTVTHVDLSYCGFGGTWSPFPYLTNFTILNASFNQFLFASDSEFPYLDSPASASEIVFVQGTIDLSHNSLEAIPTPYLELDNLHLLLGSNQLNDLSNAFLTDFSWTSKHLDLSLNPTLTGTVPGSFLKSGTSLNLSGCGFTNLDPSSGTTQSSLRVLDLSRNALSPSALNFIFNNSNFTWLSFAGNSISGSLSTNLFGTSQFPFWTHLDLSNNALFGDIPAILAQRTALEYLDLSNNMLTGNIPNLSNLTNLVVARLDGNYLDYCASNPSFASSVTQCSNNAANFSQICQCPAFYFSCTPQPPNCPDWPEPASGMPDFGPQPSQEPDTIPLSPSVNSPVFDPQSPSTQPSELPITPYYAPGMAPDANSAPEIFSEPDVVVPLSSGSPPMPSEVPINSPPVILPTPNLPVGTLRPVGVCWEDAAGAVKVYFGYCNQANETILYLRGLNNYFAVSASLIAVGTEPPTLFAPGCRMLSASFETSQSTTLAKWRLNGFEASISPEDESQRCSEENISATFLLSQTTSQPVAWQNFTRLLAGIMDTSESHLSLTINGSEPLSRATVITYEAVVTITQNTSDTTQNSMVTRGHRLSKAMANPIYVRLIENTTGCVYNHFELSTAMEPILPNPIADVPAEVPIPGTEHGAPERKKFSIGQLTAIVLGSVFSVALIVASLYSALMFRSKSEGFWTRSAWLKSSGKSSTRADSSSKSRTTNTITSGSVRWEEDGSEMADFSPDEKSDETSYDEHSESSSSVDGHHDHEMSSLDTETLWHRQRKAQESRDGYDDSESPFLDTGDTKEDFEQAEESELVSSNSLNGPASSRNDPEDESLARPSHTSDDSIAPLKQSPPRKISTTEEFRSADEEEWSEEDYSSVTSS